MKNLIVLVGLVGFVAGCGLIDTGGDKGGGTTTIFTLSDSTGRQMTTFHSGEPFNMTFALINNGDTLVDHFPPVPFVKFEILRGDSVVVTSTPPPTGPIRAYPNYVIEAMYLMPHDTLHGQWEAPASPSENSTVILPAGSYAARAIFPSFDRAIMDTVNQLSFTVVK